MGEPNGIGVLINKNRFGVLINSKIARKNYRHLTETNCHYFQNIAIP